MLSKIFSLLYDWFKQEFMFQLLLSFLSSSAGLPSTPSASCLSSSLSMADGPKHLSLPSISYSWSQVSFCQFGKYCWSSVITELWPNCKIRKLSEHLVTLMNQIPGAFYYLNSALNPVLYSLMSKRFRRGFSDMKLNLLDKMCHLPSSWKVDSSGERRQESTKMIAR